MLNEVDSVRSEVRESIITAKDSEQQIRGNNIWIRGLATRSDQNCHQTVLNFIQQKLRVSGIRLQDIEQAHHIRICGTTETVAEAGTNNTAMSVNTASRHKPEPFVYLWSSDSDVTEILCYDSGEPWKDHNVYCYGRSNSTQRKKLNLARNHDLIKVTGTWNGKIYACLSGSLPLLYLNTCVTSCVFWGE